MTKAGLELGAEAVYVELTQAIIAEVVGQQVLDLARSSLNSLALEQAIMLRVAGGEPGPCHDSSLVDTVTIFNWQSLTNRYSRVFPGKP